jgi:hypothetical protein
MFIQNQLHGNKSDAQAQDILDNGGIIILYKTFKLLPRVTNEYKDVEIVILAHSPSSQNRRHIS